MDFAREYSFFKEKKILITGHTGFKGSWLSIWLKELGAEIVGIGLDPDENNIIFEKTRLSKKIHDFRVDIRNYTNLIKIFNEFKPEIVFHLAAQPIVIESYKNPLETFQTNVMGTTNILHAIKESNCVKSAIIVTTDKVYLDNTSEIPYKETDPLGGLDPYSCSKVCTEFITESYKQTFFKSVQNQNHQIKNYENVKDKRDSPRITTVRAGNVIGGGDWQKHRIIPDCIKALQNDQPIKIRNPQSTRPWQYILDALGGYLLLAKILYENNQKDIDLNGSFNFGPDSSGVIPVSALVSKIYESWGKPLEFIKNTNHSEILKESKYLSLDTSKAQKILKWKPIANIDETIQKSVEWYKQSFLNTNEDMYNFTVQQIQDYVSSGKIKKVDWIEQIT